MLQVRNNIAVDDYTEWEEFIVDPNGSHEQLFKLGLQVVLELHQYGAAKITVVDRDGDKWQYRLKADD